MHWLAVAILCLLVALAIFLGERLRRRREEAQAYLKGVRSMISDDSDAAIEALSDAARLGSPEAVESYLALGALFRRTGDLPRAIRLHRNMLLRPGLDPGRRAEVERELADDYRRGGMLREAAEAYRPLAEAGDRAAAEGLRDVLVEMDDAEGAVAIQRRLGHGADDRLLSHLLARLARARLPADPEAAREAARAAVEASPGCADGLLALAEVEAARGERAGAVAAVGRALESEPAASLLAWPALERLGDPALAEGLVAARLARAPLDAALHLLRGRLLHAQGRGAEALAALGRALELDRSGEVTLAMRDLLREAGSPGPEELSARHDLMVAALSRQVRSLRCRRCGASAASRAWRCGRCGAFDAYP
ncbi:MAG TPA: tetratricopeptide repeat protein [Anaeromyxobacteraceae bacterium]|nr:tetratricopeptide repeat protein [Anaeromyxobacteraceae bacterium]